MTCIEHVYRENRLSLIRLGFLLTGSQHEAEDLVQTAFAAAQHRWTEIEQPIAYLRQVIVNRAKDGQRRAFRAPPSPPESITQITEVDETFAAILRLSETQRAVVVLHFYEDLSLVDIASILDRPASTVRSDLNRALTHLRKTVS